MAAGRLVATAVERPRGRAPRRLSLRRPGAEQHGVALAGRPRGAFSPNASHL